MPEVPLVSPLFEEIVREIDTALKKWLKLEQLYT